jgi:hypothetical protein
MGGAAQSLTAALGDLPAGLEIRAFMFLEMAIATTYNA